MRRFLRDNSLSLFFGALFLVTIAGQSFVGQRAVNAERAEHGERPLSWGGYLVSPDFAGAVLENWQSEFLQFSLFIVATVWLVQRGSNESKRPEDAGLDSDAAAAGRVRTRRPTRRAGRRSAGCAAGSTRTHCCS